MTLIHVPRPAKSARDPDRPVNALLKMQIEHLHEAEKRLPLRYHTEIYVNAIKTESEAARYIREVTEAIHQAHLQAAERRNRRGPARKPVPETAAAAERPSGKPSRGAKGTGGNGKAGRKK
jgi:hypothetical protein